MHNSSHGDNQAARRPGIVKYLLVCLPLTLMVVLAILSTGATALSAAGSAYYYFPWYDSDPANGIDGNWILICNQGNTQASVDVYIGSQFKDNYDVAPGQEIVPQYPDTTDGPVRVVSRNGEPLLVSQRVLFKGSFNEVIGVNGNSLDTSYYFPWYDSKPENGMRGNWILISNQGSTTATVAIYKAGVQINNPSYSIPPGGIITPQFADTIGGPIKVVSTNGQPLICSQRVIYLDSFNEVMGTAVSQLDNGYNFTWYDSKPENFMKGNWILAANASPVPNRAQVCLAGDCTPFNDPEANLQPDEIMTGQFVDGDVGVISPDVRVTSYDSQKLIASQRVLFKNSFSEVMGMPDWKLASSYAFTWYDEVSPGMRSWILVLNKGAAATKLQLCIEGTCTLIPDLRPENAGLDLSMLPGEAFVMELPGLNGGPLSISSPTGVKLLASQRVTYWDSFEEIQGVTSYDTGAPAFLPLSARMADPAGPVTSSLGGFTGPRTAANLAENIQVRKISGEQLNWPDYSALFDQH
ncbi:MAG: hypothetical protein ACYC6B_06860 [Thermoleophilia bacterium]